MTPFAFRWRLIVLFGISVAAFAAMLAIPPFAQPLWYHNFADQRCLLCVPHALNVLSNLPFVLVGVLGVWWLWASPTAAAPGNVFEKRSEFWPYATFFACIALTGVGSVYYHSQPNNATLLWDRLPLAMALMALFAAILTERIASQAGKLLVPLVLLGAGSVLYWHYTEMQGAGDMRAYLLVQFYPLLALPFILLLFPPRYTRSGDLVAALAAYIVAKFLELLDSQIYAAGQIVSGHTLKHLVAALSCCFVLLMLMNRRPTRMATPV